jgi:hypothetical protein
VGQKYVCRATISIIISTVIQYACGVVYLVTFLTLTYVARPKTRTMPAFYVAWLSTIRNIVGSIFQGVRIQQDVTDCYSQNFKFPSCVTLMNPVRYSSARINTPKNLRNLEFWSRDTVVRYSTCTVCIRPAPKNLRYFVKLFGLTKKVLLMDEPREYRRTTERRWSTLNAERL